MRCFTTSLFVLIFSISVAQVQSKPLSNDDVIQMVSLGISDDVIIEKIRSANTTNFDTTIDGLKSLKAAKVSDAVLKAMINPHGSGPNSRGSVSDDDTCLKNPSAECRATLAGQLQAATKKSMPDISVHALEDTIVFASIKFNDQGRRATLRSVMQGSGIEQRLCGYGFKRVRFVSSAGAMSDASTGGDDLRCAGQVVGNSEFPVDFVVRMSGHGQPKQLVYPSYNHGYFDAGVRTPEVCWMHVSDGRVLYVIQNFESVENKIAWRSCFTGMVGSHYPGRVSGDYIEFWVPEDNKMRIKKYVVVQTADASTTQ